MPAQDSALECFMCDISFATHGQSRAVNTVCGDFGASVYLLAKSYESNDYNTLKLGKLLGTKLG